MKIINKKVMETYQIQFMKEKIKLFSYNYTLQFENPLPIEYFSRPKGQQSSAAGAFIRITFDDLTQKDETGEIIANSGTGQHVNCRISVTLVGNISPREVFHNEMHKLNFIKWGRNTYEYERSSNTRSGQIVQRTTNITNAEDIVTKVIGLFNNVDQPPE